MKEYFKNSTTSSNKLLEKNGLIIIGQGYYKLKKVNEKFKGTKLKLIISIHSFIHSFLIY